MSQKGYALQNGAPWIAGTANSSAYPRGVNGSAGTNVALSALIAARKVLLKGYYIAVPAVGTLDVIDSGTAIPALRLTTTATMVGFFPFDEEGVIYESPGLGTNGACNIGLLVSAAGPTASLIYYQLL